MEKEKEIEKTEKTIIRGMDNLHNEVEHEILTRQTIEEILDNMDWDKVVETAYNSQVFGSVTGIAYLDLTDGIVYPKQYVGNSRDIDDLTDCELIRYDQNFRGEDIFDDGEEHSDEEIIDALKIQGSEDYQHVIEAIEDRLDEIYGTVVG